jgi:hypothetical protein
MQSGRAATDEQKLRFIEALCLSANVSASAQAAGVRRRSAYRWREEDPEFAEAWTEAIETATDALELEVRRRAVEGVQEYVIGRDGPVKDEHGQPLMQRRYSDGLLMFFLKAHRPERYRERSTVDLNVQGDLAAAIEEGRRRVREGRG